MILVTGGTGLVGAHLLYELALSGEKIRALKRSTSNIQNTYNVFNYYTNNAHELFSNIEWFDGDLLDIFSLYDAMEGVNKIYHCAAIVSFNSQDKNEILKTNIIGTTNIVNTALDKSIEKLCYVSSIAALGKTDNNEHITENTVWKFSKNISVYSKSKFESEREIWRGIAEGLDAVIVNPSIILGPSNWNTGSSRLFKSVWDGLKFYTQGVNGYVDVRDVVSAMVLLMNSEIKNERFILSSENINYQKLFMLIAAGLNKKPPKYKASRLLSEIVWRADSIKCALLNSKPLITKETARTANAKSYYSNHKLKSELGFEFIPVEKSIKDICNIFLKRKI